MVVLAFALFSLKNVMTYFVLLYDCPLVCKKIFSPMRWNGNNIQKVESTFRFAKFQEFFHNHTISSPFSPSALKHKTDLTKDDGCFLGDSSQQGVLDAAVLRTIDIIFIIGTLGTESVHPRENKDVCEFF